MSKIIAEIEFGVHTIEPLSIQFDDYTTVSTVASPYGDGVAIFKNGTGSDLSSTHMPSGSVSASGNILTTKPITSLLGGNFYILTVVVTTNGTTNQAHAAVKINCVNEKSGLMRTR